MNIFGLTNEKNRQKWISSRLASLPKAIRILDAGAGELRNRPLCSHLNYVSQDFCQYQGTGDSVGLQTGKWDTHLIDIVCDITDIPEINASFDAILCSEVFEHIPDPTLAIKEFSRLLKPGGSLILTAPFCSLTHFAPYFFATGFSRYWYEFHLAANGFEIIEAVPNGNWFDFLAQEIWRLPRLGREYSWRFGVWVALILALPLLAMLTLLGRKSDRGSSEILNFGWQVVAKRL
jgi:SAM-dependent methyltransferase